MSKEFKPNGYNSASPYFVVNGVQEMVDLLKELFHATEKRRYDKWQKIMTSQYRP